jgi:hypothetical protein
LYRSPMNSFTADSSTQVGEVAIGSNTNGSIVDIAPDCGAKYFYVIQAFNIADVGSGFVGDEDVTVKHKTKTSTRTITIRPQATGAIPVAGGGAVSGAGTGTGEGGTVEGAETQDEESGQVLGEGTKQGEQQGNLLQRNWPWILGIIIVAIIYGYIRRRKNSASGNNQEIK